MKARLSLLLLAAGTLTHGQPAQAKPSEMEICGVRITAEREIDLSRTEREWLCGSDDSHAWRDIPVAQKEYFLRNFLQERGYHEPEFTREGDVLRVKAGPPKVASSFTVEGAPAGLRWERRRRIVGQTLTPTLLTEAANWVKRELQESGYPCPVVESQADKETGAITVRVRAGAPLVFGPMESQGGIDLPPEILDRFTAYVNGQPFDVRLLEMTSRRILEQDLYLSTYYDTLCDSRQQARIVRRFVPAPPRLITAGVGFDTESGPLARARYRRVRIGHAANVWESTLFATLREQSLESRFHWHFTSDLRSSLRLIPLVFAQRLDEKHFATNTLRAGLLAANEWEKPSLRLAAELGPTVDRTTTLRGSSRRHLDVATLKTRLSGVSHLFEYYLGDPREGWNWSIDASSRVRGVLSDSTHHRISVQHEALWNLGRLSPPLFILGWRGWWGAYLLPGRDSPTADIPVQERFYLGGSADIRGFGRKALPGNERGFLTVAYQGIELRAGEWITHPVQPLLFFDIAKGSEGALRLSDTLYYAPGIGARYLSPFGSLRATLGRGYVRNPNPADPKPGAELFLSFGKEF